MNRISVRGAAVATAMASTSVITAVGIAAFTGGSAAADPLSEGYRFAGTPTTGSVVRSALEPAAPTPVATPTHTPARRVSRSFDRTPLSPRDLGRLLAAQRGWTGGQWSCLDKLWTRESNWKVTAQNGSSGAYGIPQSLPASKMAAFGSDWRTSARTQIRWGLSYIERSYGTPCAAWHHSQGYGYY